MPPTYDPARPTITPRIAAELIHHEGLVREAYRDSVGVWTWSVGITDASGHRVGRYRDQPQPQHRCLEVYLWALQNRYLPAVLDAFGAVRPEEHELAAALSFHWNTGAIGRAAWMGHVRVGDRKGARQAMLDWCRPASLAPRRKRELALFFDARWAGDGTAIVYEVAKPSYQPTRGKRHAMLETLILLLEGGPAREAVAPAVERIENPPENQPETRREAPAELPSDRRENWFTRLFTC